MSKEHAILEGKFLDLADIDEVWGQENKVLEYIERDLDEASVEYRREPSGTIIAYIPGRTSDPPVSLCGHVDKVSPINDTKAFRDGNVIRTDGTRILGGDDGTSIAGMLTLAGYMNARGIRPRQSLKMLFTTGEEAGLYGARALPDDEIPDRTWVFDWIGGVNQIVSKSPAMRKIDVNYTGVPVHVAQHEQGKNAGETLLVACGQLARRQGEYQEEPSILFNMGVVQAGDARNKVAGYGKMLGEIRSHDLAAANAATEEVSEHFRQAGLRDNMVTDINVDWQSDPYVLDTESDLYEGTVETLGKVGLTPVLTASDGCYDANIFNVRPGKKAIVLGAAYYNPHQDTEYVDRREFYEMYEFMKELVG